MQKAPTSAVLVYPDIAITASTMSPLLAFNAATALPREQPTCDITSSMSFASSPVSSASSSSSSTFGASTAPASGAAAANCWAADCWACAPRSSIFASPKNHVAVGRRALVDIRVRDDEAHGLALLHRHAKDPRDRRHAELGNGLPALLLRSVLLALRRITALELGHVLVIGGIVAVVLFLLLLLRGHL